MITENDEKNNVYLSHIEQDGWNDVQAYQIENATAWRNIAVLAIIALVFVSIYAMYIASQDKHKTLIFEKDSVGNITTLGLATTSFNVDNKMIAHQLANFILALREVPLDVAVKRRNIDLVHKMIDPKIRTAVDQMLINQYTAAKDGQIVVEVNSIKPLSGNKSWEITWSEVASNSMNNVQAATTWSTIITFTRLDTVMPAVQIVNPIGLFITYLHPIQDLR